jgi:hypothetical protein
VGCAEAVGTPESKSVLVMVYYSCVLGRDDGPRGGTRIIFEKKNRQEEGKISPCRKKEH